MYTTDIRAVADLTDRLDGLKIILGALAATDEETCNLNVDGVEVALPTAMVLPMFASAVKATLDELIDKYGVREPPPVPPAPALAAGQDSLDAIRQNTSVG